MTEAQQRKKANKELATISQKYHKTLPISEISQILSKNGFDSAVMEGIYCGHTGKVYEQVGKKTWIIFTWYKMPSGNFEINVYVS